MKLLREILHHNAAASADFSRILAKLQFSLTPLWSNSCIYV